MNELSNLATLHRAASPHSFAVPCSGVNGISSAPELPQNSVVSAPSNINCPLDSWTAMIASELDSALPKLSASHDRPLSMSLAYQREESRKLATKRRDMQQTVVGLAGKSASTICANASVTVLK